MTSLTETSCLALVAGREADADPPRKPLKRRAAASMYLWEEWGIERAVGTLAKLAVTGGGPRFRKAERVPLYDPADLDAWARDLLGAPVTSMSELRDRAPRGDRGKAPRAGRTGR